MHPSNSNLASRTNTKTHSFKPRPPLDPLFSSSSSHGQIYESGSSRQHSDISRATTTTSHLQTRPRVFIDERAKGASRRQTQELISIFETATTEATITSQPLYRRLPLPPSPSTQNAKTGSGFTKDSPLRASFRNLVSAFNKAKRSFGDSAPGRAVRPHRIDAERVESNRPVSMVETSSCATVPFEPSLSQFAPSFPPVRRVSFTQMRSQPIIGHSKWSSALLR